MSIFLGKDQKRKQNIHVRWFFSQKRGPLYPIGGKPIGGAMNGIPPIGAKSNIG